MTKYDNAFGHAMQISDKKLMRRTGVSNMAHGLFVINT
jgi:hypothetical protein